MKLVSSNKFKLKEFKRFGLDIDIQEGLDLKEVLGTSKEVVIYKAIEAGENLLVEDTILEVDGVEIVDIRKKINQISQFKGKEAIWRVSLACLVNGEVLYSTASVKGEIKEPQTDPEKAFGFDPYFYPKHDMNLSLHSLELSGLKDSFSARKMAIGNFLNQKENFEKISINSIPKWTGEYQKIH